MVLEFISCCTIVVLTLFFLYIFISAKEIRKRRAHRQRQNPSRLQVAFFHPYCHAGGGGERVLWTAVAALQNSYSHLDVSIYSVEYNVPEADILARARERFGLKMQRKVHFIFLTRTHLLEASTWPVFTLLGQSLGSLFVAWQAIHKFCPDVYIDSIGCAFTLPLFKFLGGCRTSAYVHYPTISTDMLHVVRSGASSYNNKSYVAKNVFLRNVKLVYYRLFAWMYGSVLRASNVVLVNSTWTYNHIIALCGNTKSTHIVYPPCDVSSLLSLPDGRLNCAEFRIVSVGQFRPEKNHCLLIEAFAKFLQSLSVDERSKCCLVLIGGCRGDQDERLVEKLKILCKNLDLSEEKVAFKLNIPYDDLKKELSIATVGLHGMTDEHFGICVVEYMAAGCIPLAHASAGPLMDIVIPHNGESTGFLACDENSYADSLREIFFASLEMRSVWVNAAKASVARFDEEAFTTSFVKFIDCSLF